MSLDHGSNALTEIEDKLAANFHDIGRCLTLLGEFLLNFLKVFLIKVEVLLDPINLFGSSILGNTDKAQYFGEERSKDVEVLFSEVVLVRLIRLVECFDHEPEVLEERLETLEVVAFYSLLNLLDKSGVQSVLEDHHVDWLTHRVQDVHASFHRELSDCFRVLIRHVLEHNRQYSLTVGCEAFSKVVRDLMQ